MTSLLLVLAITVQGADRWASTVMALAPATHVRVSSAAGAVEGDVEAIVIDHIALRVGNNIARVSRDRIVRIEERTANASRWKRAGLGFVVGLGLGAATYALSCGHHCMAEEVVLYTGPGELIGAVVGAALPTTRWRTVYAK